MQSDDPSNPIRQLALAFQYSQVNVHYGFMSWDLVVSDVKQLKQNGVILIILTQMV